LIGVVETIDDGRAMFELNKIAMVSAMLSAVRVVLFMYP
jgi:hypothetical protein